LGQGAGHRTIRIKSVRATLIKQPYYREPFHILAVFILATLLPGLLRFMTFPRAPWRRCAALWILCNAGLANTRDRAPSQKSPLKSLLDNPFGQNKKNPEHCNTHLLHIAFVFHDENQWLQDEKHNHATPKTSSPFACRNLGVVSGLRHRSKKHWSTCGAKYQDMARRGTPRKAENSKQSRPSTIGRKRWRQG